MNKYFFGLIAFLSITAGAIGFYLIKETDKLPAAEYALHYQQSRSIADFTFTDELGQPFQNEQLLKKWSLVFFGYTSCPDVCPMTLQKLDFIYSELTTTAENTQVILVSVDPQRDTQSKLSQYIGYFNNNFKALRAGHEVLFPFSRSLGLMYAITDNSNESISAENRTEVAAAKADNNYWVDHSASLVLINPAGKVEAIFKPEQKVGEVPHIDNDKLLSDYQKIVALYNSKSG